MKTKLILLLLVLVALVFTFAACGETTDTTAENTTVPDVTTTVPVTTPPSPLDGEDAKAAYEYVSEKMAELHGFEAKMIQESSYFGETSTMEADIKINLADGKKGFMSMKLEDGSFIDATYIDGIVYCLMKMTGFEMKYTTQDESMTSMFEEFFSILEEDNGEEDKNEVASVVFGKRENGVYTLVVTATEEAALASIMADYESLDVDSSEFSNISNVMTFECNANGYVTKIVETLTYTFDGDHCSETTTCTFKNVGTLPAVSAPADADSYMNMDEME